MNHHSKKTFRRRTLIVNFIENVRDNRRKNHKVYSLWLADDIMEKVDLYCKGHRISRSEFAREAFKIALEKAKSSEKHGFVYFIRAESTYKFKIGYSKDPDRRITEIDPTSPFELHIYHQIEAKNAERLEYELHKHFAKSLLKNEWYSLDDSDLAWLKGEGYRSIPHIATHIL